MTLFTKKGHWLLLGLFMLITFFANLGALPTDIMESRNIVTGREMVSDGNWLVPTMNGELRLEKPPLPTWIAGAVECVAPGSLTAQRVPAALMGCLWTVCLLLLARYIARRDDYAMAATMVFLTCYNLILMGRSATWDIYCHAFMMAAIYHLTRALFEDRHSLRRFALAGTLMGLSFLSKGPVAFYALLLPYLVALTALRRPRMAGKWGGVALLVLVMTAIGAWWYVYLLKLHPIEASQVFHKETGSWADHNTRPWYYYWRFFLETGVWTVLVLGALAMGYCVVTSRCDGNTSSPSRGRWPAWFCSRSCRKRRRAICCRCWHPAPCSWLRSSSISARRGRNSTASASGCGASTDGRQQRSWPPFRCWAFISA